MASDDKKTKAAPKGDVAAKAEAPKKTEAKTEAKIEANAEAKSAAEPAKAEAETSAPSNYSRGEGQKAVTQAYKDNWNAIYGKTAKKKKR